MLNVDAIAPRLIRKRRIGNDEIKRFETTFLSKVGARKSVALPDVGRWAVMKEHVHLGNCPGSKIVLLPVDRQINSGRVLAFVMPFEQQRAGAACGVINRRSEE